MQFDKIKVGQSLKRKREEIGLTQLALAIKMCVSESTVKKWEQGKRTPQLPDWLSLASILKTNVSTLIGEIEVKEMKNILEDFIIINQEAKDAEFFESYEDVLEAWNTYYRTYDKMVNDENIDFIEWEENNNFIVLISQQQEMFTQFVIMVVIALIQMIYCFKQSIFRFSRISQKVEMD